MRIILLTQYFPPETGAPQNRLFATATSLQARGAEVTVLTAMPNYPENRVQKGYRGRWYVKEMLNGIPVHRAWIFVSASRGMLARLFNYFSFVFSALIVGSLRLRRSDVLLVESPPLFLGITAMLLARVKRAKMVFNVSDLWPESAVQLGLVTNRTLIQWSTLLEMRCYRRSAVIIGQTQGIVSDIQRRCPGKKVLWIPNGVDLAAIGSSQHDPVGEARSELGFGANDLVFAYAGIIGHAQGLDVILRAAALLRERKDVHFLILGDGPDKERLMKLKDRIGDINVRFLDRMPRHALLALLRAIDAVVVPLRKNDLFKGAIPSKIFEALALRKPIVLGVEGEARELFIDNGKGGIAFEPENEEALARAVLAYHADRSLLAQHGANGERYVRQHFDRERINDRLWQALNELDRPATIS